MTIQDGDINKHLDEKPPKDKLFIWSLLIVMVIISILLVILIKPEIFTDIIDKFVPEKETNTTVIEDDKEKESYIPDDVEYSNVTKEEADKYYDIAYYMSEYLKEQEYLFTDEAINDEYVSIWTKDKENFAIWFTLNEEYDNKIQVRSLPEDASIKEKITFNEVEYKKTSRYFKEEDLKNAFYQLFPSDYTYNRENQIGYHGCYLTIYNEKLEGYIVYQCVKACKGGLYSINYNLTKAEVFENYLYLYDVNLETGKEYMYTLINENGTYKFMARQEYDPNEEQERKTTEETPQEETPKEEESKEETPADTQNFNLIDGPVI